MKKAAHKTLTIPRLVLDREIRMRKSAFNKLIANNIISAELGWDSPQWRYQSRPIHFDRRLGKDGKPLVRGPNNNFRVHLTGAAADLARCYAVRQIARNLSYDSLTQSQYAFGLIADLIGDDLRAWSRLDKRVLNTTIKVIESSYKSIFTIYNRANAMSLVVQYLTNLRHPVRKAQANFMRSIHWHHGIINPITETLDPTREMFKRNSAMRLPDRLGEAIAKLRWKVANIKEPKPGCYRIIAESLAFLLAQGWRSGELTRTPVDVFDRIDGIPFTRVYTEKGQPPAARPISPVWENIVEAATIYLRDACADARKRAEQIEQTGFTFLYEAIAQYRRSHPLSDIQKAQIASAGLDENRTALPRELAACFGISHTRYFCPTVRRSTVVALPNPLPSLSAQWLDARFKLWDWSEHVNKPRTSRTMPFHWKLTRIGIIRECAAARGSKNSSQFNYVVNEVNKMLIQHRVIGSAPSELPMISEKTKNALRRKWKYLRSHLLKRVRGNELAVDLQSLESMLSTQYNFWLEHHYKELRDEQVSTAVQVSQRVNSRGFEELLPLSHHLIVIWENQLSTPRKTIGMGILPRPLFTADIRNFLTGKKTMKSAFEIFDIMDDDGKPYRFAPKQIRHWVTTAMLRSGANEHALDLWMGRTPGQSRNYDHRTATERALVARTTLLDAPTLKLPSSELGRLVAEWRKDGVPIERQRELLERKMKIVYHSPWGSCDRWLTVNPCEKGHACLSGLGTGGPCRHFHIDPEDETARLTIVSLKRKSETTLALLVAHMNDVRDRLDSSDLNTDTLGQHEQYLRSIIVGCDTALAAYEKARNVLPTTKVPISVSDQKNTGR